MPQGSVSVNVHCRVSTIGGDESGEFGEIILRCGSSQIGYPAEQATALEATYIPFQSMEAPRSCLFDRRSFRSPKRADTAEALVRAESIPMTNRRRLPMILLECTLLLE
jgi:hypothetical protein